MVYEYNNDNILFIKGCYIKDCKTIDQLFETQILEKIVHHKPIIKYDTIPSTFTSLREWPTTVNIHCWYCSLTFDTVPVFIPKVIEPSIRNASEYTIATHGCFCSFNCAIAYNNLHNVNLCKNIQVMDMILFIYKIFNNGNTHEIYESPNKYTLTKYGGLLTPGEYKDQINILHTNEQSQSKN